MRGEPSQSAGSKGEGGAAPEELCDGLAGRMGRVKERPRREAIHVHTQLIPQWFSRKEATYNAGYPGSIPGSGRPPGEGNGSPLQHPCLENPMDRGAWQDAVHGVQKESDVTSLLNHTPQLIQIVGKPTAETNTAL